MNILIDIGNSRLKWALHQVSGLQPQPAIAYREQDYAQLLRQSWQNLPIPQKLAISSVAAPDMRQHLISLAVELWPAVDIHTPLVTASGFGVRNAYPHPEKLGVDRWLSLLAAHHYYPGYSCIVDCGTAITLDMLDADGQHLGGLICPGLQLMKKALSANTAALDFDDQLLPLGLADNTFAAIDSGCRYAALGIMETVLARLDKPCRLILSGGDAEALSAYLQHPCIVDVNLVFKGLGMLLGESDLNCDIKEIEKWSA
jgi:type III pantothenate kinase